MNDFHTITVGISDCAVSRDANSALVTHALGSCIAVAIYDPLVKVAGLLHFLLPDSTMDRNRAQQRPLVFADTGIPHLFHAAYELGASKQRLIVTALGGAQVLDAADQFNIGKRNYLAMRKVLWKAGVMIHNEDVGGALPRNVRVETGSGRIFVSHARQEREIAQPRMERGR